MHPAAGGRLGPRRAAGLRPAVRRRGHRAQSAAVGGKVCRRRADGLHRRHSRRLQQPVRRGLLRGHPGGLPHGGQAGRRRPPLRPRQYRILIRPGRGGGHPGGGPGAGQILPGEGPPPGGGGLFLAVGGHPVRLHSGEAVDVLLQPEPEPPHRLGRHDGYRHRLPLRRRRHLRRPAGHAGGALRRPVH